MGKVLRIVAQPGTIIDCFGEVVGKLSPKAAAEPFLRAQGQAVIETVPVWSLSSDLAKSVIDPVGLITIYYGTDNIRIT